MKKTFKIFLLSASLFILFGCVNKKAMDSSQFETFFTKEKYEVYDVFDQLGKKENIKEVYIAKNDKFQIEFYVLNTIENARKFYKDDIEYFENKPYSSDKNHNYESYEKEQDKNYIYVSRIDKTVIFILADKKYKEDITKVVKKMGY